MQLRNAYRILLLIMAAIACSAQQSTVQGSAAGSAFGRLPLTFEANHGQTDPKVNFLSRGKGYTAFLTAGGIVLSLHPSKSAAIQPSEDASSNLTTQQVSNATLEFRLLGAANNPMVVGENQQPGRVNYFIGNDPAKWKTNVPIYTQVRYKDIYPGIDLLYYGSRGHLEYDFAVSAGADPGQIRFQILGAKQIHIDSQGNLVIEISTGELHFQAPTVYQSSNGRRVAVSGEYVVEDLTHISFHLAQYDANQPLVIDPVLLYSTYLGGSGNEQPGSIAVDSSGDVYIAGSTDSTDFPLATLGSLPAGNSHVFVAKLDPTGSNLIYADYLGGNAEDYGYALAIDASNDVYVTGSTTSSNFPTTSNAFQATYPGASNAFLSELSPNGSSLLYSTYFGGNGSDAPSTVAVDATGEMVIAGSTSSTNLPVAYAYQSTASPNQDGLYGIYGFVTKFNAGGASLVYSTYFGGYSNVALNCGGTPCWPAPFNVIAGMVLDGAGNAYVTGTTNTYNFPATVGAYQTSNSTGQDSTVGFVSELTTAGGLQYSTYLYDPNGIFTNIGAITVDGLGSAYVTGVTLGSGGTFPTTSTSICNPTVSGFGCNYAFVTKFDTTGSTLLYSTYLGPNNNATPSAIALDSANDAYVLASTSSGSFTTVNEIEGYSGESDVLLVEIDATASSQLFATYLGGSGNDQSTAGGIAVDGSGNIYAAGITNSTDFPVTPSAFQTLLNGNGDGPQPGIRGKASIDRMRPADSDAAGPNTDAFIVEISSASSPAFTSSPASLQYTNQAVGSSSQPQSVLLRNMGSVPLSISSIVTTGDFTETDNCGGSVPAAGSCTFSVTFTPSASGSRIGSIAIDDNAAGSPNSISLTGTGLGAYVALAPASLTFTGIPVQSTSAAQTLTVSNTGNTSLLINSIQVTGDYAETNNCGASVAAQSTCTVNITFTPTQTGTRTGTVTINDSAVGGPQTVSLSGAGSDFTITTPTNSATVNAGVSATYMLTVAPVGGAFPNAIQLGCGGAPATTTCGLSLSAVTPGSSSASVTLTISTTASSAALASPHSSSNHLVYPLWAGLQGFGIFGVLVIDSKRWSKKLPVMIVLAILVISLLTMSACAGGTGILPQTQPGTTPGTYTVTVTGTSGALQHSLPLTLTVQ